MSLRSSCRSVSSRRCSSPGCERSSVSASSRRATSHGRGSARTSCCREKFALYVTTLKVLHIDLKFVAPPGLPLGGASRACFDCGGFGDALVGVRARSAITLGGCLVDFLLDHFVERALGVADRLRTEHDL